MCRADVTTQVKNTASCVKMLLGIFRILRFTVGEGSFLECYALSVICSSDLSTIGNLCGITVIVIVAYCCFSVSPLSGCGLLIWI